MRFQQAIARTLGRRCSISVAMLATCAVLLLIHLFGFPPRRAVWSDALPMRRSGFSGIVQAPGRPPVQEKLGPGKVLVASRHLRDPNFAETVVLLLAYGPRGAQGLIINRPTTVRLAEILPKIPELRQQSDTVYIGGPVSPNRLMLLVQSDKPRQQTRQVFADIYVSDSRQVLQQLANETAEGARFRVYAGYAGWAPGQLDREVARGDWHVMRTDVETVFDEMPSGVWPTLIRQSHLKWL